MPPSLPDENVLYELVIWPHRSLSRRGFWVFMGILSFFSLLLIFVILYMPGLKPGSVVVLAIAIIPFFVIVLGGVVLAYWLNNRAARLHEVITFTENQLIYTRYKPRTAPLRWQATPYWVRVKLRQDHQHENVLELVESGRRMQIGAFLSPEERENLADDLITLLADHQAGRLKPQSQPS